ncbi:MAG: hypothetical protein COW73_04470 [Nitrospirae bacterium CG18_big_fil_WC_8_21_14_2_50_70_55]|nr:hybrid sensor histidine kinase/response regulator [Deltaproteobacteria bacterium]OIP62054.1 MAG: hypothetical protein AUK30_10810 [Nitrospirae bacterium CG2_30_70_394]PIQ05841.1 MAG: hypothetical protein COW73_04470 [Nitrospirae bacterium CG18_big_fil_WC_8_21_14_2_50_70_55]PIU79618.1 MAG: hypothetical protein COS73_03585 [Nitrospirae bacterium CG06_land_8_20_14_3_00_70_43]PIW82926.1 MAG: hypothetical protein COZ96_06180 [Nitrospirae bacterium CG_4_8_14_3_um_filter_70_85]PIX83811.1 MAG: hypo
MSDAVRLRILAIDDDVAIQSYWRRLLPKLGHDAVIAANGTEGIKLVRSQPFDLVVTDLSMPGLPGQRVLETVRAELADVDVIVATGHGTLESAVDALRAGAYDFLVKPFSLRDVKRLLDRQVEKRRLGVENEELRQANARLRELSLLKEKFLAITSHELKTPVTILTALTELLVGDPGMAEAERLDLLDKLGEVTRSLREIVEGMHDLAEARQGAATLRIAPVGVRDLLAAVVEELAPGAVERGVAVELTAGGRAWDGYPADATRLRRALRQLVRNGIQYTPDGGRVTLHLDAWQGREGGEEGPEIVVADTGVGIDPKQQRLVFDAFYETGDTDHHHTSTTAFQGGGLGIGLSMVLETVTAHEGRITLDSEPGHGTTVRILLPPASEVWARSGG